MIIKNGLPSLVLAPMDGVTDHLMRQILTTRMPFSACVSEFVRVSGLVPPAHVFTKSVPELLSNGKTVGGTSVALQLLGGDPERLALSAERAVSLGARCIDLNFGCPAPTVNRHDGGATLLKFPERIKAIVSAVRSAVPNEIPVSAKFRLGWDTPCSIHTNAEQAVDGGASWIAINGRTKMQGYTPPAFWKPIGEVRRSVGIPVIANGEIWCLDDLKRCQEETGGEHFMLGRGVLANPLLVLECASYLKIRHGQYLYYPEDCCVVWAKVIRDVVWLSRTAGEAERRTLSRIKQWLNYASKRGSIGWFDGVKRSRDIRELQRALENVGISVPQEAPDISRLAA